MSVIPERTPIEDFVQGAVLQMALPDRETASALIIDNDSSNIRLPSDIMVLRRGTWIIRYGIRLLEKPRLSIVPGLLALDYGEMLTGEDAWEFLIKKSNLYPRADVVGYRNDGVDDMLPVKRLDLALPIDVLAFDTAETTIPTASITVLILPKSLWETERAAVPSRLTQYLTIYEHVEGWQQQIRDNDYID
jgi:hypothetical protein